MTAILKLKLLTYANVANVHFAMAKSKTYKNSLFDETVVQVGIILVFYYVIICQRFHLK